MFVVLPLGGQNRLKPELRTGFALVTDGARVVEPCYNGVLMGTVATNSARDR